MVPKNQLSKLLGVAEAVNNTYPVGRHEVVLVVFKHSFELVFNVVHASLQEVVSYLVLVQLIGIILESSDESLLILVLVVGVNITLLDLSFAVLETTLYRRDLT